MKGILRGGGRATSVALLLVGLAVGHVAGGGSDVTAQCASCVGDANSDGEVTINELITAVNNALFGCDAANRTPTPTVSVTVPTPTPTTSSEACAVTPGAWSAPGWATNAAGALALRAQLGALTGNAAMRGAEQGTVVLGGVAQLEELYTDGDPSLAEATHAAFDALVDQSFAEFVALIDAGTGDAIDAGGNWTPGPNGGIYGNSARGLNAGGLEVRQIVDKGMFAGGTLYRYAVTLTEGEITPGTVEALAAAWGVNESLDPAGTLVHSANYSRQMGFFAGIAAALTDAHAYAGDGACVAQRDDALRRFFALWEQSMLARLVYYANLGHALSSNATGDNDHIEALHQLTEGIGLAIGFRGLPEATSGPLAGATRTITDAQLDEIAAALGVNLTHLNASTTGELIEDAAAFATVVTAVEDVVAEAYDLDEAEIESYRTPTAG